MRKKPTACARHANKTLNHTFRSLEVGNNTVFQRANRFDVFVGLFVHQHRFLTDSENLVCLAVNGNDGWLVNDDLVTLNNQRIGSAKVNG